jgi:hypothetical protein
VPRRGANGDDAHARRAFNKLYRQHRLTAQAAGLAFPNYNQMVDLLAVRMRERGYVSIHEDVEQLLDRVS